MSAGAPILTRPAFFVTLQARLKASQFRRWVYPVLVFVIYLIWSTFMTVADRWHLFQEYWPASVTMAVGSFVAGATPLGGAAVAFPVFTKVLHIPSADARTFGLMIQTMGMTMASVVIIVRGIRILPHVVGWVSLGSTVGMILGAYLLIIPSPYPKVLFTMIIAAFGLAMALTRWKLKLAPQLDLPGWNNRHRLVFFLIGVVGGAFSANTGNGADMFVFILLTLAFGLHEKVSTPTSVIIMAINSMVGFFLFGAVFQNVGIIWNYWLVAVPIVILGAPLGAYFASRVNRDHIIAFVLVLIGLEFLTTLWLVPIDVTTMLVMVLVGLTCLVWFRAMMRYRQQNAQPALVSVSNE